MPNTLELLKTARQQRQSWFEIAKLLRAAVAHAGGTKSHALLSAASEASGYSPNLLSRYLAALDFTNRLLSEGHADTDQLRASTFGSIECLKRIWAVDANIGSELIGPVLSRTMGVMQLRSLLSDLSEQQSPRHPQPNTNRIRYIRKGSLLDAVEHQLSVFTGGTGRFIRVSLREGTFARAHAIFLSEKRGLLLSIDGFHTIQLSAFASNSAVRYIATEAALSSTYFRRYWLVLGQERPSMIERLAAAVRELSLRNVGIALIVPPRSDLELIVHPSHAKPEPDRRDQMMELVKELHCR